MPRIASVTNAAPAPAVERSWPDWVGSDAWQENTDGIPMLPALAHEIAEVALNPDVPAIRISGIVSKDPVLATSVIQLANSAFSAPAGEITSINEAVVRMGTSAVRSIVTASCLTSMMANPKIYGARGRDLIDHSIGTAYLARLVADGCGGESDEAFLAGLLHDIGKLLILKLASETHHGVARPLPVELETTVEERHAEFGGFLVTRWQLPKLLQDPIVWHHEPDRAAERPLETAVIYVANRLAHRYGFGCARQEIEIDDDPLFARVNVDSAALARLDDHVPGLFAIARKITT
jgi:putative nucleotidyltransferase with HDIG domain